MATHRNQAGAGALPTAAELIHYAEQAERLEEAMRTAEAVFHAIAAGGLLDAAPVDEVDRNNHSAGTMLLDILEGHVRRARKEMDDAPGTDLSIYLHVLANEAKETAG